MGQKNNNKQNTHAGKRDRDERPTLWRLIFIYNMIVFFFLTCILSRTRLFNTTFPHFASVRSNNSTRARLEWTLSYICCNFVHPDLDSARERSIDLRWCEVIRPLIIKITISSIVIGLQISYFPLIHLPSCYWTVCYRTVQLLFKSTNQI